MSYLTFCSSIQHHCPNTDSNKLKKLHEKALRYIYRDRSLDYRAVTDHIGYNLADRRLQDMLIIIFKVLNNRLTVYIENMFRVRTNIKNLRGRNKLVLPHVNTTRYAGLKSVVYTATKAQKSLPDDYRTMTSLKSFKTAVGSCLCSIVFLVLSQLVFKVGFLSLVTTILYPSLVVSIQHQINSTSLLLAPINV